MAPAEYKTFTLYNGEVTVKFYPNSHMYKVTDPAFGLVDQRVKGVTTFLGIKDKSTALVSWATETAGLHLLDIINNEQFVTAEDVIFAIKKHATIKDEASNTGTIAHEWCEYFIKHKLGEAGFETAPTMPEDPSLLLSVHSFLDWYTENDVQFISSERVVYSREHQFIGTMDFDAIVNGSRMIGDFKTSNGLYNGVRAQTSAYQFCAEEENPDVKYDGRIAVRLCKEGVDEYRLRMERKNYIKGKELDAPYPPHNPLEVRVFPGRESYEYDFNGGFLSAKELFTWDADTDFYQNDKKALA